MSFADYDDIYRICCDWRKAMVLGDEGTKRMLFKDEVTEPLFTQTNSWWEAAEREILSERERVFV